MSNKASGNLEQLQEENSRLRRALNELAILNDLAREISAKFDLQQVMQTVVKRSIKEVHAEQGTITLVDAHQYDAHQTLIRSQESSDHGQPFHLNQGLLGWMLLHKQSLVIEKPREDPRFHGIFWDSAVHSVLCVPLLIKSELIGILTIVNKKDGTFTEDDTRLLSIVAAQSAQVIENVRLYEEEQNLLQIKEELRLASQIQTNLYPKSPPEIPGYDVAGYSKPAQVVGGDYYDFIPIDQTRWAFCVGDVSGKGLPAALLMANLQAIIRGQCLADPAPGVCLRRANKLLHQSTDPQKYATLFFCTLDIQANQLVYSNAGHNWPFLIRQDNTSISLKTGGVALSFIESAVYDQDFFTMNPGDFCVLYSDGVTEAMNGRDEPYGEERLLTCILGNRDLAAESLIQKIVSSVELHADHCPQSDDITLLVIKRR